MNGLKLYTDGRIEKYDIKEKDFEYKYQALQKSIDCDCIDIVHAVNLPDPYCLVVDDEGLLVAEPQMNLYASYLYGALEHGQPICGDCIIMKDDYTPDGIETIGLEAEDFNAVLETLKSYDIIKLHKKFTELYGGEENENS